MKFGNMEKLNKKLNKNLEASGIIHLLFGFSLKFKQHHRMFLNGTLTRYSPFCRAMKLKTST